MKFRRPSDSPLKKRARRGFRGYPIVTIAFYGPDDKHASKASVGIVTREGGGAETMKRWFSEDQDIRADRVIGGEILQFIQENGAKSVVMTEQIIGCPHEEGIDYPDGATCPHCPFWANRDRWTGDLIQ